MGVRLLASLFIVVVLCAVHSGSALFGSSNKNRILLQDVSALTLRPGQVTTGRRSQPVQQLHCVGGCQYVQPSVVQCHNTGFDGYDVQWECKTEMDNKYRFGRVSVSCEGYDHPDDPYVLRGSCGLKYSIELTEEGKRGGYGSSHYGGEYHGGYDNSYHHSQSSGVGSWALLMVVGLVAYGVYRFKKMNEAEQEEDNRDRHDHHDSSDHSSSHRDDRWKNSRHRSSHSDPPPSYASATGTPFSSNSTTGGGGFWSGAATGGLLGYLFGSRNSGYGYSGYHHRPHYGHGYGTGGGFFGSGYGNGWSTGGGWGSSGWGSRGWGSSGWSSGGGGGFSSGRSHSSGSRTSSGFGGTERR